MSTISWRPDTCGCHLKYDVIDGNIQNLRIETSCQEHKDAKPEDILAENQQKNNVFRELHEKYNIQEEDYKWEFDENRKLIVKNLKPDIASHLKQKFPGVKNA